MKIKNGWFPIIMTKKEMNKLLKDTGFKFINNKRVGTIKNIKSNINVKNK